MPLSAEADSANDELKKLPIAYQPTIAQHKTRAELLMKAKHWNDAVDEYRELAVRATPENRGRGRTCSRPTHCIAAVAIAKPRPKSPT